MQVVDERARKHAADGVDLARGVEAANASPLAPRRFAPIRGLLKLLVEASSSRSTLRRLVAWLILLGALSVFAFLGFFLPKLISFAGQ